MAAVSLVRQGRCRGSFFLTITLLMLSCVGCSQLSQKADTLWLESTDKKLQSQNGIVYCANQPFTGAVITFYPTTRDTAEIARYVVGKEDGIWQKYYENGSGMEERAYSKGKKTGEYLAWWPNGNKKLHFQFADDEYEGSCKEWNENGGLVQEMNYKNGHEEGSQKMFYDNGKTRSNYTIIRGKRYGLLGTKNCVNVADSVFIK